MKQTMFGAFEISSSDFTDRLFTLEPAEDEQNGEHILVFSPVCSDLSTRATNEGENVPNFSSCDGKLSVWCRNLVSERSPCAQFFCDHIFSM